MSKYKAQHKTVDGIQFDSKMESDYYLYLKEKLQNEEILDFQLQPEYILQEGFLKNGKLIRPIKYKADFLILHLDATVEIVDVKGFETPAFLLKQKLFEKKYPYTLTLVKYVKKYGGWVTFDEYKERKKEEKKVNK